MPSYGKLVYSRGKGLKKKLRAGTVYYRKVDAYPSIQQQIELRWRDTLSCGSSTIPASVLYELCVCRYCAELGMHKDVFRALSCMVMLECETGLRFFAKSDITAMGLISAPNLMLALRWCVHHDLLLRVERGTKHGEANQTSPTVEYLPNGKKRAKQYYFLTVRGQGVLNEFHAFVQEEYTKLQSAIAERKLSNKP